MSELLRTFSRDADGQELIEKAILSILNSFPGLPAGETFKYQMLGKNGGLSFYNESGSLVIRETRSITKVVRQKCNYSFIIVFRRSTTTEVQKLFAKEFLDALGKWMCGERSVYNSEELEKASVPVLSGGRKITKISRGNSYGIQPQPDGTQDWVLPCSVEYENVFREE